MSSVIGSIGDGIKNAAKAVGRGFFKAGKAIDIYTSPRPGTEGNFDPKGFSSYVPALFQAGTEGYYFLSWSGAAGGMLSCATGLLTEKVTNSLPVSIAAGAISGAGLMIGLAMLTHAPASLVVAAVAGALLGVQQLFRGNHSSKVRDSAGNAALITGFVMPGSFKLNGGIASGLAAVAGGESKIAKLLIGGAAGAALTAGMCAAGLIGGPMLIPVAVTALAGMAGPFLGPRFSQFFRNFSEDTGKVFGAGVKKVFGKNLSNRIESAAGAIPSSFIKEGTRGLINTDMDPWGFLIGGASECIQQAYIFMMSKRGKGAEPQTKGG